MPKGFGIKADHSHSTRKALSTSFRFAKPVINTNTKSSYPYGYETGGPLAGLVNNGGRDIARTVAHVPTVQTATNRGEIKQKQPDFRCVFY